MALPEEAAANRRRVGQEDEDSDEDSSEEAPLQQQQAAAAGSDSEAQEGAKDKGKKGTKGKKKKGKGKKKKQKGGATGSDVSAAAQELTAALAELEEEEKEEAGEEEPLAPEEEAWVDSHFDDDGTKPDKKGVERLMKRCKICAGKMQGLMLGSRRTNGRMAFHQRGNMKRHLLGQHGRAYKAKGSVPSDARDKGAAAKLAPGQQTLGMFAKWGEQEEKQMEQAIVLFCALDNRPFAVVDGPGFKHLIKTATKNRYTIPSRRTIARRCTTMAAQARARTQAAIEKDTAEGATYTTSFDAWTDRYVDVRGD